MSLGRIGLNASFSSFLISISLKSYDEIGLVVFVVFVT